MKKVTMFVLMLLLAFAPSQVNAKCSSAAKNIPVNRKKGHLGTRAEVPNVSVSLANEKLTIEVNRYVGEVNAVIMDSVGCVVANKTFVIDGNGKELLETFELSTGFYSITIELDNVTYYGIIDY